MSIFEKVGEIVQVVKIRTNEIQNITGVNGDWLELNEAEKGSLTKRKLLAPLSLSESELCQLRELKGRTILREVKKRTGKTVLANNHDVVAKLLQKNRGSLKRTAKDAGHKNPKNTIYYVKTEHKLVAGFMSSNPSELSEVIVAKIYQSVEQIKTEQRRQGRLLEKIAGGLGLKP